ncbi:MAG: chemotaxis protein CheB [Myxococcota bacterium]|nr:chemotaxis protein CheB [Myxococcota bacterium]
MEATSRRDLVVIGCSAGGVEALPIIMHQLPKDLEAAVCIVQHMAATSTPYLVDILQRSSELPIRWAEQGEKLQRGHVYVAPPDLHLLIGDGHMTLSRSARENHSRPSIDKLFRSAAANHGSGVIATLLTGMMEDGVAGLRAVRDAGGVVLVQDPATAAFAELPRRALLALVPDRTLPIQEVGTAIKELAGQPVKPVPIPNEIRLEAQMDGAGIANPADLDALGRQTPVSCPECAGPTWQIGDPLSRRFRCYVGHVTTAHQLLETSVAQLETALWSAARAPRSRLDAADPRDRLRAPGSHADRGGVSHARARER